MKAARLIPAALLALIPVVGVHSAASAAEGDKFARISLSESARAAAVSYCGTGRVASTANRLPIRVAPFHDAAKAAPSAMVGYQYNCTGWYALGDRYTACGTTNANGWLEILINGRYAYTYMTCLKDV